MGRTEPHSEGVANHADLESCAGGGDAAGEALTEALAGRPLSREILRFGRRPCGQKGKATCRTTHVYGAEESEWAIVPAKDSNKDEKSLAESLEGRACTKENARFAAHRPHTEAGSGDTVADEHASGGCVAASRSPSSEVGAV